MTTYQAEHSDHKTVSMTTYVLVFAALMVLLFLTVWVGTMNWSSNPLMGVLIALAIAVTKAILVVLFFMHVIHATRLTQIFVVGAFLWLGLLFLLTFQDYLTRSWTAPSRGWVEVAAERPTQLKDPVPQSAEMNSPTPGTTPETAHH